MQAFTQKKQTQNASTFTVDSKRDAGYFLEKLYFCSVIELIENKSVRLNDLRHTKYVCICIMELTYLLEFDENEIRSAVENQTIPENFSFNKIHHMQKDEQSVHRGSDEEDEEEEEYEPYELKEGEQIVKRFCTRAHQYQLEAEERIRKILESEIHDPVETDVE
jgi:hypothetical protein